ncbi:Nucleotidyltransferase domain-containing protein [Gemmobacter aquatilis]|uniref:Nucleotidyltransferase domain-containing protein n=1 Tax=Gemmobacter aquatilis TaxID=933059 RepID=A0A1H7Y5F9_9RHOB|nr:nucleotidyltransferase domain-containing protein [Gemmobacter aquatilis]SEM41456.1 Nucleotidyltransferase domain-containing protein [Gemmobacter aquatilis]
MSGGLDIAPSHLAQVRAILAAHLPPGVAVQVFGSRARGGAKPYSDLDLVLSGPCALDPALLGRLADAFEDSALPWKVDLVDLHRLTPEFRAAVTPDFVPLG